MPVVESTARPTEVAALVCAAAAGDHDAFTRLVRRFDPMLRSLAGSYRLCGSDIDDVVQATWLGLLEHIGDIRNPDAIRWWLSTTTRRHALNILRRPLRERVTDDLGHSEEADTEGPEEIVLAAERSHALAGALRALPDRHRKLMNALVTQPSLEYQEISRLLSIPVGSIGPTRARSLTRLARDPQLIALR